MKKIVVGKRLLAASIVVCAATFAATTAKAAVEAQGILVPNANPTNARFATTTNGLFSVPYTVQSPNTDVIVVGLYFDSGTTAPVTSLEFNDVARTGQITSARSTLAYWYMDPGTGTFDITGDTSFAAGIFANGYVWELSGVDVGALVNSDTATGALPLTNSMTTSSPDRIVIDFFGGNKQDGGTVAPSLSSIVSEFNALQFGGTGGGTVAGGSGTAISAGPTTLGWRVTNGTIGDGSNAELAYAFALIPNILELNVNTFTGQVEIVNPNDSAVAIDYYRITSTGGALSPGTWNSLDDQDVDATGMDVGQSWDESGSPDANGVIESFLRGETNLASGDDRSLGQLFNPLTFGKREDGDLVFQYGVVGQNQLRTGVINYIAPPGLLGDYNDNGTVDAADYTVYRNRKSNIGGSTLLAINEGATPGIVTIEDYQVWKDHYGESLVLGSGSSAVSSENVPEPASLTLLVIGIFAVAGVSTRGRRT